MSKIYDKNNENINIDKLYENDFGIFVLHLKGIKYQKQRYILDVYISQLKVFTNNKPNYIIPSSCLINNDNIIYESDEDILDQDVISNIKMKEKLYNEKKELQLKLLQIENKINKNIM